MIIYLLTFKAKITVPEMKVPISNSSASACVSIKYLFIKKFVNSIN